MGSDLIDAVRVTKSKSTSKSAGKVFPPGFRFHPTDEELVLYYLKRKICRKSVKLNIIGEVDVYKWDPQELPGQSKLKTGDRQWFFFSPRDRKYPNGGRSSRATMNGYWKATGKDRIIKRKSSSVGIKKTLVYYQGRAPSGLRTDWVMHEYTMDEEELQKCHLAQDHFALYKIFKKSGPGPKNGEQYGAPFVEEEWSDDDFVDAIPVNSIDVKDSRSIHEEEENNVLSNDIIEYLNKIIDEPELLPPLPQITEKTENCLLENSSSQVEKDFIEMDDLIGSDPGICGSVPDFDSFFEFDFYHESNTFGGNRHLELQAALMDNLEYGPENSGLMSEIVNHDLDVHDELPISYDLWNHDQGESSITTGQTANCAVFQSSPGMVVEENPGKPEYYINQCPETNMQDNDNTDSWFSSALWAFVDSIPTTPASASESSALVNKVFERMSSFGRGKNVNLADAMKRLEKQKPSRSSRGIVYFSVLGILFAVLMVSVGSSIEILGRCIWW